MSSSRIMIALMSGFGAFVSLGLGIAMLVVVLTIVRRHRPDAVGPFVAAAVVGLVASVAAFASQLAGTVIARQGMGTYTTYYAATSAFFTILRVLDAVLFMVGLARIARPARAEGGDPGRYQ